MMELDRAEYKARRPDLADEPVVPPTQVAPSDEVEELLGAHIAAVANA